MRTTPAPIQFNNRHTKREATAPTFHYDLMDEAGLREDALGEIRRWHESTNDLTKWDLKEHWYTPSDNKRKLRKFVYMSSDLPDLHLGILDHQAEMAWFEEAYKPELDVLRPSLRLGDDRLGHHDMAILTDEQVYDYLTEYDRRRYQRMTAAQRHRMCEYFRLDARQSHLQALYINEKISDEEYEAGLQAVIDGRRALSEEDRREWENGEREIDIPPLAMYDPLPVLHDWKLEGF